MAAIATANVVIIPIIQESFRYPPNDFTEFSKPELMGPEGKFSVLLKTPFSSADLSLLVARIS